jgi:FMN phosphatase YigB (HAD superfamily)
MLVKKWLKIIGVIVLVGVVGGGFLYLMRGVNAEREALRQVIKRQEEQLREKEQRIQELEDQLEVLRKEQVLREKRAAELKRKRQEVKPPQDTIEVVERLKKLGYEEVRVK